MSFKPFNWRCPFCGFAQTVTEPKHCGTQFHIYIKGHSLGSVGGMITSIACSNEMCQKLTLGIDVRSDSYIGGDWHLGKVLLARRLMPESSAKPQPDYIPEQIRQDYVEACRIRELSPKASATLARRCLQGMIRDFSNIEEKNLYLEIEALRKMASAGTAPKGVSEDSIEALHHIRSLGNIGAHMEQDIDLIVPVDESEVQVLIELIESLFDEWYIARNRRDERFAVLAKIANEKAEIKALPKAENS